MENDNNKIASNIRSLIYCINKYFIKKKKILSFEFMYKLFKKSNRRKNLDNIYIELFNEYKKKEKKLNELKNKFNKSEEKLCTFSPSINHNKIIKFKKNDSKKENKNKSYEIKFKNTFNGYLNKIDNNNNLNKYETIDNINNNTIFNFVNDISKNNLYNTKYISNYNTNTKNYFLLNTSRKGSKFKTLEQKSYNKSNDKRNYSFKSFKNDLFKETSGNKINNKSKAYFLNIKRDNQNKFKDKIIKTNFYEQTMRNIYEKKYNTINIIEKNDINDKKNIKEKSLENNKIIFNNIISSQNSSNKKSHQNEESKQRDYYYSFRGEKLPYNNSFNNTTRKKYKNVISENYSKISFKKSKKNKINKIPISLRDNSKFKNFGIITKLNQIYSNNYNKKINKLQKCEQDYNINNNSFYSKKESTRQQSNTNLNTNNDTKRNNYSSFSMNMPYEIVNVNAKETKKRIKNNEKNKNEKAMTLQSLSDSKMMELAENYINKGDDSFEIIDLKYLEFKKNIKKEKQCKELTFG